MVFAGRVFGQIQVHLHGFGDSELFISSSRNLVPQPFEKCVHQNVSNPKEFVNLAVNEENELCVSIDLKAIERY